MSKLNRLGAMLVLVALVGVAWAGATKIPSFVVEQTYEDCFGAGTIPLNIDPAADGMAILNYASGADKTIVQVIVSDFSGAPLGQCIVRMNPDPGFDLGTFTLDSQGNGHFRGSMAGNHADANIELWQQVDPPFPPANCPAVLIATGQ